MGLADMFRNSNSLEVYHVSILVLMDGARRHVIAGGTGAGFGVSILVLMDGARRHRFTRRRSA